MTTLRVRQPDPPTGPLRPSADEPDGVICFGGEDWWYHNRGHYDMQMMQRLAGTLPVLYVNSIGMRLPTPREGPMFFRRVRRKLRSMRRGLVPIRDGFWVYSPVVLPGPLGLALTRGRLAASVRRTARRLGIKRPLVWVACPTAAGVVETLDPAAIVYQRTDRYEQFPGVDREQVRGCDALLKQISDVTVFCSAAVHAEEAASCRQALLVDHGVDLDRFAIPVTNPPTTLERLPRPRIGFVGSIDAHTFDPVFLEDVATRLPDHAFALIGPCSLPPGWCRAPNVHCLGPQPYENVPSCLAACDALIMPWRRSPWIDACNPVKLKEYLASGRPIVSTPFAELTRFSDLVRTAATPAAFAGAIRLALEQPGDAELRRARVVDESWSSKAETILRTLTGRGLATTRRTPPLHAVTAGPGAASLRLVPARTHTPARGDDHTRSGVTPSLAACVLLSGGLTPSPLTKSTRRSVLDLWLSREQTVLDAWLERVAELEMIQTRPLPVRVVHDLASPPPWLALRRQVSVEREPVAVRGPAGVARDACIGYAPETHVMIAAAARFATSSLAPLLREHAAGGQDVTIAANGDGSPAGIYLVRCAMLQEVVAPVGFMDLKEQWLPAVIRVGGRVAVHHLSGRGALPLRTRAQFLEAARRVAANAAGHGELRVVCPGVKIGPGAVVTDSIVMPGAIVGPGAVVARSIVCPGAEVPPRSNAVSTIVDAGVLPAPRERGVA
ncbi:MAG: glycosyltransferase [Phycisphaerales bacterium]|nr:glycosyltransferase [Phycisphaerae bacterium]NNF42460.1 glycosyltransferase [Phycisphaerales bacterium]NNM27384.1 glycosyltransferase [Phycisphaerales bacterium]